MLKLTKVYATVNNQKRKLYYGNNVSLKCIDDGEVLAELFENWFLHPKPTTNLAIGEEYLELEIADVNDNLADVLNLTSVFEVKNVRYKLVQEGSPKVINTGTNRWYFRLAPTGERT